MKTAVYVVLLVTAFQSLNAGLPDPRYSTGQLSDQGVLTLHFNQLLSLEFHRIDHETRTLVPKIFGGHAQDNVPTAFIKLHRTDSTQSRPNPPICELYIYKSGTWRSLRFSGTVLYRGDRTSTPFTFQCDDRSCSLPFNREVTELRIDTFTLAEPPNHK